MDIQYIMLNLVSLFLQELLTPELLTSFKCKEKQVRFPPKKMKLIINDL